MVARVGALGVDWVVRGLDRRRRDLATEQTKGKIVDPSGNVIELKTYRDVEAALETSLDTALETSPHSYPERLSHGN